MVVGPGCVVVEVALLKEQTERPFRRWREHGRIGERVALPVHVIARGANGFRTDAQNRCLARRANPQVAMVEQKIDAMLFELNGKRRGIRHSLDNLNLADANLVTAGSTLLRANLTGNDDARFLRQALQRLERLGIFLQRANALDDAGAIEKSETTTSPTRGCTPPARPASTCTSQPAQSR